MVEVLGSDHALETTSVTQYSGMASVSTQRTSLKPSLLVSLSEQEHNSFYQHENIVSTVTCDDCFLKQMQTKLQMPLISNTDLASTFTSLTSACRKTNFAVTPPATSTAWISR